MNFIQFFDDVYIPGFDFTKGYKCNDFHRFVNLKKISEEKIELNQHQEGCNWQHNLIPSEISKKYFGQSF